MVDLDIRTRVELTNTTVKESGTSGQAGKVAVIGAFPSHKGDVLSFTNLSAFRRQYNINAGTPKETQFDGCQAVRRIFMDGITGYKGASSITVVNICADSENPTDQLDLTKFQNTVTIETIEGTDTTNIKDEKQTQPAMKLTWDKLTHALNKIADESMDMLFISSDLRDITKQTATINGTSRKPTINEVYEKIVSFINDEFSAQKPTYIIHAIQPEQFKEGVGQPSGIPSSKVQVYNTTNDEGKITSYGACGLADFFNTSENELTTAYLGVQTGKILDESVGSMQIAAHMCGFIASIPVSQDLTYQTIPGITGLGEELYFGENDAGYALNSAGIQVIKPKNRISGTYCVNNAVQPSGWHTNHVRAISYLLKAYGFEAGLGINNFNSNLAVFKAQLNTITNTVMNDVPVIRDVEIGDIDVISPYEIYVPVNVKLAGVITIIKVGVNMELQTKVEEEE